MPAFLLPALLFIAVGGAALSYTLPGRTTLAYLRTPDLIASPKDANVIFQPGSETMADLLAQSLPEAMARVEAAQGSRFRHPITIRLFSDWQDFKTYTGFSGQAAAVTQLDRISFSPKLMDDPARARVILTHELSHALLHQNMGIHQHGLPSWFDEGLAVLISDDGSAPAVLFSKEEALTALHAGRNILPDEEESLFTHQTANAFGLNEGEFYRQSELFVGYMRDSYPEAFGKLLAGLSQGHPFPDALRESYAQPISKLWQAFCRAS